MSLDDKHGVDFTTAAQAFTDPRRQIYTDARHRATEERLCCLGKGRRYDESQRT